jgi:hypothetical protein
MDCGKDHADPQTAQRGQSSRRIACRYKVKKAQDWPNLDAFEVQLAETVAALSVRLKEL